MESKLRGLSTKTANALKATSKGNKVLLVFKNPKQKEEQFNKAAAITDFIPSVKVKKTDKTIHFPNGGELTFMSFAQANVGARGCRCMVVYDEYLQRDLETFQSLATAEYGYKAVE